MVSRRRLKIKKALVTQYIAGGFRCSAKSNLRVCPPLSIDLILISFESGVHIADIVAKSDITRNTVDHFDHSPVSMPYGDSDANARRLLLGLLFSVVSLFLFLVTPFFSSNNTHLETWQKKKKIATPFPTHIKNGPVTSTCTQCRSTQPDLYNLHLIRVNSFKLIRLVESGLKPN